jgi:hypothetical protein
LRIDNPASWAATIAQMRSRSASSSRVVANWSLVQLGETNFLV